MLTYSIHYGLCVSGIRKSCNIPFPRICSQVYAFPVIPKPYLLSHKIPWVICQVVWDLCVNCLYHGDSCASILPDPDEVYYVIMLACNVDTCIQ